MSSFSKRLLLPLLALITLLPQARAGDLNLVGTEMVRILQNGHYARLPYDEKMGQRFLKGYLEALDPDKVYFTQPEVDLFQNNLGNKLHDLMEEGKALKPASGIYEIYRARVAEQTALIETLLAEEKFTFESARELLSDRDEIPWPTDLPAMKSQWKLLLEESLLAETLRREKINHAAKEQGKESPFNDGTSIAKKISQRQERLLKVVNDAEQSDIANYLFSAVARSHDPHCEYQSPREHERFRINISNQLVGIGASLQAEDDGATKIVGIIKKGPADEQGDLKLADRIVGVSRLNDGEFESVMFLHINKVVEKILGAEGTEVGLKISDGDSLDAPGHVVVIKRGKVIMKEELVSAKIYHYNTGQKIGVISIPSFYFPYEGGGNSVSTDVRKILERFQQEDIAGVVLDLMNNGGGSLDEVATMVGLFVSRGPVVQTKTTSGTVESLRTSARVPIYTGPLVMLTTKGSASATEILAAALQDYNRAVIVGSSSTFGKGTIQRPIDISRWLPPFAEDRKLAGHIKFTTGKYYRVSGGSVQQKGVIPDLIVPAISQLSDEAEFGEKFNDYALPYDVIGKAADFDPLNQEHLFLDVLRPKSMARLGGNRDFQYRVEDIALLKKELSAPVISLNIERRRAKLAEFETRRMTRNIERRTRFASMEEQDRKSFRAFRLKLDDLDLETLPVFDPKDDEDLFMRRKKSDIEELDDTPEWPSGIHPVQREGLSVLLDLIEVTKASEIAGTLTSD